MIRATAPRHASSRGCSSKREAKFEGDSKLLFYGCRGRICIFLLALSLTVIASVCDLAAESEGGDTVSESPLARIQADDNDPSLHL